MNTGILINTAIYTIGTAYLFAITFVFYLAIMNVKKNRHKLTTASKFLIYPILFVGLIFDFCLNVAMSPIFLELPMEMTLTSRLKRHKDKSKGYKLRVANWICGEILNPYGEDEGHC